MSHDSLPTPIDASHRDKHTDRRNFLRMASVATAGALLLRPQSALASVARLALGSLSARPFNLVTIGDSIMWGQGLSDTHKFRTIIRDWIAGQLPNGRTIQTFNAARSGARIQLGCMATSPQCSTTEDGGPPPISLAGEVPNSFPSITFQAQQGIPTMLRAAGVPAADVDLVLLTGGINDVLITRILTTDPTINGREWIRKWTQSNAIDRMGVLLDIVTQVYPNARVVLIGYFPIISGKSSLSGLGSFIEMFSPVTVPFVVAQEKLTVQSRLFYDLTNDGYKKLAAEVNRRTNTGRVTFVKIDWLDEESYGAPERLLWLAGENDEVRALRQPLCDPIHNEVEEVKCRNASAGHPNVDGARFYASMIQRALVPVLCDMLQLRPLRAQMTPGSILVDDAQRGVSVTVNAVDAVTGAAVNGTVTVFNHLSRQVHPTGTAFRAKLYEEFRQGRDFRDTAERRAVVTVSAPGYCGGDVAFALHDATTVTQPTTAKTLIAALHPRASVTAQSHTVTVTDAASGQPVTNAVVHIEGGHTYPANQPFTATLCVAVKVEGKRDAICRDLTITAPGYPNLTFSSDQ